MVSGHVCRDVHTPPGYAVPFTKYSYRLAKFVSISNIDIGVQSFVLINWPVKLIDGVGAYFGDDVLPS